MKRNQGMDSYWETYEGIVQRLRWLDGLPCPLCRAGGVETQLSYANRHLECPNLHSWSNPAALIADLKLAPSLPRQGIIGTVPRSANSDSLPIQFSRMRGVQGDQPGWHVTIGNGETEVALWEGLLTSDRPIFCLVHDFHREHPGVLKSRCGSYKLAAWLIKNHGYQLEVSYANSLILRRWDGSVTEKEKL